MEEKKLDEETAMADKRQKEEDLRRKANEETLAQRREEIVSIVCKALEGWHGVEPSAVIVELVDFLKTHIFKVSAKMASPSVVILKFGTQKKTDTSLGDRRTEAATAIFGNHGICPVRLAQSDDISWWIEACAGPMLFDFDNNGAYTCSDNAKFDIKNVAYREKLISAAVEYGRLLAKIHATPTDWFSPFTEEGVAAYPLLRTLPEAGSFLWLYQYRDEEFGQEMTYHSEPHRLQRLQALLNALPTPRCPALARLVTSHGDLWYANVLWNPEGGGLLACDLESSCVMRGIYDWMHCQTLWYTDEQLAMTKIDPDAPSLVRTMLRAYLQQLGEPAKEGDVDVAVFDIRSFIMAGLYIRNGLDAMYFGPYGSLYGEHAKDVDGQDVDAKDVDAKDADAAYDNVIHNVEVWQQRMQIVWDDPEQRRAFVGDGWLPSNQCETFWSERREDKDYEPKY